MRIGRGLELPTSYIKQETSNSFTLFHLTVLRIDNFGESGIFFVNIVVIVRLKSEVTTYAA